MSDTLRWLCGGLLAALLSAAWPGAADTLDAVRERGTLRCGVNGEIPGLSYRGQDGDWSGLDVDFCRAVAAAALGSPERVELVALSTAERFAALREGRVDLLARNTSWTQHRALTEGVAFAGVLYYDGQGFLVPRASGIRSTLGLDQARICAIADTTSSDHARRYFTRHRMRMELTEYPDLKAARRAYLNGECSTLTGDHSQLHVLRATLPQPEAQRILPETISREPLAPAVRQGETRMLALARSSLSTLINAEALGIGSDNAGAVKARAENPAVRTLLDLDGETADALGVEPQWGYRVIRAVGNYGELFERNLGKQSGLDIKRGMNALWNRGGLLYAPPPR